MYGQVTVSYANEKLNSANSIPVGGYGETKDQIIFLRVRDEEGYEKVVYLDGTIEDAYTVTDCKKLPPGTLISIRIAN